MQEERSVVPLQLNDKYSNDAQFFAKARAALLSVGIIKAAQGVNAETLNQYVEAQSAPVTACKLTDQERSDVARFLNRYAVTPFASPAPSRTGMADAECDLSSALLLPLSQGDLQPKACSRTHLAAAMPEARAAQPCGDALDLPSSERHC